MATLETTANVVGTGIVKRGPYIDILFTAAGADTFLANTLLAVDSSTLKAVPFVKGGTTNDNGTPRLVLTTQLVTTGAGDTKIRAMQTGELITNRTVIHADGDSSNIDNAVKVACTDQGITLIDSVTLGKRDNT